MDDDLFSLKEGETDPVLGKKIETLIISTNEFIVYLDDKYYVEYRIMNLSNYDTVKFGIISNHISRLEELAKERLESGDKPIFHRLLGESMARFLLENDLTNANDIIKQAESFMTDRSEEKARSWIFRAAMITSVIFVILIPVFGLLRTYIITGLSEDIYQMMILPCFSVFGAFISLSRNKNVLITSFSSGRRIHNAEGVLRILTGLIGSVL
ncbi:MAG TPA: hypothetical protein VHP30_07380, partial [Ignavibacteriales bacterium]|nr:hypothetical protein [Ignavibacteriales bacterium]